MFNIFVNKISAINLNMVTNPSNVIPFGGYWGKFLALAVILFILIAVSPQSLHAQEQLEHSPRLHVDTQGQVFTRADQPAYFFVASSSNPTELIPIPSPDQQAHPMHWDGHGSHFIAHSDPLENRSVRFRIMADGVPPLSGLTIQSGQLFSYNNFFYAKRGVQLSPTATDAMSGVGQVYASFNGQPYTAVMEPIVVSDTGEFTIRIYAVDNVGNVEEPKVYTLFTTTQASVQMDNIYFELNSSRLSPNAFQELNRLASILNQYKEISLHIAAHTDARGDSRYNLTLSQARAQAVVSYLAGRGVDRRRLSSKGYGDTKLVNECYSGVQCPEDKHRENRRVELTVKSLAD